MKKILTIIMVVLFAQPSFADLLLRGEAEYNVTTALMEIQQNIQPKINLLKFKPFLLDYNYDENLTALYKGIVELKDRELALFSVGTYGVVYKNDPLHAYYYSNNGILEFVDIRSARQYPYKSYQYDMSGNLVNMGLRVSKSEAYLYTPNGKLVAHWVGENGYDEKGYLIMKRKFVE